MSGRRRTPEILAAIGIAAFAIRLIYVWQIHGAPFFGLRLGDAEAYHEWARRIAAGDWLGRGVFYQAPLYPYVLAAIYRMLDESATTVRVVQAAMGAASCALLAAAGVSLFGRRGALAGAMLAIYAPAIFFDGLLEKSALATLLVCALLALISWTQESRDRQGAVFAAGAVLGLLALTRENALALSLPILLWMTLGRRQPKTALLFAAGCALILLPVALRNLAAGGEFQLTTAQAGPNFYIGNHAGADGTYQPLVTGHGNADDEREDATRLAEQTAGRKLSPGEVSHYWTQKAVRYIREQPLEWMKLTARKFALTLNAAEAADTESQEIYAQWSPVLRFLRPFDFGVVLGLAALGGVLTARSWRSLWWLYGLAATYAASVTLFYVFARYRFPLVPVLLLPAAAGVFEAWMLVRSHRMRALAPAALAMAAAVALSHLPLEDPRVARATNYMDIAVALAKEPERLEDAKEFYGRALAEDPRFPAAQFGLGTLLARMDRPAESIPRYRQALAVWPDYEEAHYNLGLALASTGQAEDAVAEYAQALRIRPDDAEARLALGKTLVVLGRFNEAAAQYTMILQAQPRNAPALIGLGVALAQTGHAAEALEKYRLALEIDPRNAAAHNSLGTTLATQGRIAEAVPYFERALELNPADENARRNLEAARAMLERH